MERRMTCVCFLVSCLLVVWLSPVGYADPGLNRGDNRIDINKASVEELVQLPRVGQAMAQRIISYREENGPFRTEEDLKAVRGIGDKVFEQIRPQIRVE